MKRENIKPCLGVFLQARYHSTRLPGKALLPLADKNVLALVMDALSFIPAHVHLLLTDSDSLSIFNKYSLPEGFNLFSGPREDVLARFYLALEKYPVDHVVRATGDNPLVSISLAKKLIHLHLKNEGDYSGFIGTPIGTGVEIIRAAALKEAYNRAEDPYEREHVAPYIYRRPHMFNIILAKTAVEYQLPNVRVTLDTEDDYELLKKIYGDLYDGSPVSTSDLIKWLKTTYIDMNKPMAGIGKK